MLCFCFCIILDKSGEENIKSVLPLGAERKVLKRNSLYQSQPFPVGHTQQHNQAEADDGQRDAATDEVTYLKGIGAVGNHILRRVDR